MTLEEFQNQYQRLQDVFPNRFKNQTKAEAIFSAVDDMTAEWFRRLVDRIVCTPHGDVDIREAAMGERRAIRSVKFAEDVAKMSDIASGKMTDAGFEKVISQYGVNSIWEAVQVSRKGI